MDESLRRCGLGRYVPNERYKNKKSYDGPRLHDLRHLKGQMLIKDVDIATVADDLGHTQLSTTRRYVRDLHQEQTARVIGSVSSPQILQKLHPSEWPMSAKSNDPGGFRTHDLRIKSPLLYQLSYRVGSGNLAG